MRLTLASPAAASVQPASFRSRSGPSLRRVMRAATLPRCLNAMGVDGTMGCVLQKSASCHAPIRLGVLGTGRVVTYGLLQPSRQMLGMEVRSVASRSPERARAFATANGIPHAFGCYEDLLTDDSINAVYIALPPALHSHWTHRAIEMGKHVLCEKPLGVNAEGVQQAIRHAEQTDLVLQEAMHIRQSRLLRRGKEILASKALGAPLQVGSYFRHPDVPMKPDDFRLDYELGGGACLDFGCYAVAGVRYVLGEEPSVISARCECIAPQVDRWMQAKVKFPSGANGTIECGFRGSFSVLFGLTVKCEQGSMTLDLQSGLTYTTGVQAVREPNPGDWTYKLELEEFARRACGHRSSMLPESDPVGTARVLDAMYESAGLAPRCEMASNDIDRCV